MKSKAYECVQMLLVTTLRVKLTMDSPVTLTHLLYLVSAGEDVGFVDGWEGHVALLPPLGGDSFIAPRTSDAAFGESREGDDQRPGDEVSRRVTSGLRLSRKDDDLPMASLRSSLSRAEDDHRSLSRGGDSQLPLSWVTVGRFSLPLAGDDALSLPSLLTREGDDHLLLPNLADGHFSVSRKRVDQFSLYRDGEDLSLSRVGDDKSSVSRVGDDNLSLSLVGEDHLSLSRPGDDHLSVSRVGEDHL